MPASQPSPFDRIIDRSGTSSAKWDRYRGRDILPFWVADMDFAAPEFIRTAIAERLEHPILGYTRTPESAIDAFQDWLQRCHGWTVPEEWLVWIPGVVTGFNLAARAVAEPGGSVLIPTPVYHPFLSTARHADQSSIEVPMVIDGERWVIDFDALREARKAGTRLLLICNPQNPTGRAYSKSELATLADFCLQYEMYLCSDEIHCSLVLDEHSHHVPIASLSPEIADRTISLYAATKTYNIPGLGCAVAVIANPELRKAYRQATVGLVPGIGPLAYVASAAAFADTSDWLPNLLAYLRANHERLHAAVGERMTPVQATYLAWIDLTDFGLPSAGAFFESHGLGLSDGAAFGAPGYARFNFGCPRELLERGLARFETAMQTLQTR